jgi:hypothetical protein
MTATALQIGPAGGALPGAKAWAVRLIDRRTGTSPRRNGSPLVMLTATPDAAAAELLAGRDSTHWETRAEPIGPARNDRGQA